MHKTIETLRTDIEIRRRGVTDPQRLAAVELQNITDVLLELLKEMRQSKSG